MAATGTREDVTWNQPGRPYDIDDLKGAVELLCRRLGFGDPVYTPHRGEPVLHPGRTAAVRVGNPDGRPVMAGWIGELHPAVADEMDLRGARVVLAELSVAGLQGGIRPVVRASPPPRHPAVERDLAVVVAATMPAGDVAASIRASAGDALTNLRLFDVYRGAPLGGDEKSLAFRLTLKAGDVPLADADIEAVIEAITVRLAADVAGRIRT
jgi:phenylalanyl-tRNA synthetase beta chain